MNSDQRDVQKLNAKFVTKNSATRYCICVLFLPRSETEKSEAFSIGLYAFFANFRC